MELVADLHLHSRFSRAVSPRMDLAEIASWAARKGIGLVATGDWQHPLWREQLEQQLEEVDPGIFALRGGPASVRFLLSTEVSCIYRQDGRGRRIHHLIFSPSLESCAKVAAAFAGLGANLVADGRPILPISSRHLLELLLQIDRRLFLLPAHVWTPWFGTYGSKSGFDSLEECFGPLAAEISAVETGLSSDPAMNWRLAELSGRSIVSFSDAHSGPKLAREATVFRQSQERFSYDDLLGALRQRPGGVLELDSTIEFFPEEGKYHWTGHRACGVRYSPAEERLKGITCPACGRPLTSGVEHRVEQLASRILEPLPVARPGLPTLMTDPAGLGKPFVSLLPLLELLQTLLASPTKAGREYDRLVAEVSELSLLRELPYPEVERLGGERLAAAIRQVRERQVSVDPGYDGVFGEVTIVGV